MIKKCTKKRRKVFWAIEKWTFFVLKNVHFWISEKSLQKCFFVTEMNFYGLMTKNRSTFL